jgi:VanZ family protein
LLAGYPELKSKLGSALDIGHFRSKTPQLFIIWIVAITALSVIPYSKNGIVSLKLTESGMVMHFMAYFVASSLFYWAYGRKEDSGRRTEVRSQTTEIRVERIAGQGLRKEVSFIFLAGLLIFMFSVVLEIVQLYLPYRTFNPVDIAANGFGILFFVVICMVCWKKRTTEI